MKQVAFHKNSSYTLKSENANNSSAFSGFPVRIAFPIWFHKNLGMERTTPAYCTANHVPKIN